MGTYSLKKRLKTTDHVKIIYLSVRLAGRAWRQADDYIFRRQRFRVIFTLQNPHCCGLKWSIHSWPWALPCTHAAHCGLTGYLQLRGVGNGFQSSSSSASTHPKWMCETLPECFLCTTAFINLLFTVVLCADRTSGSQSSGAVKGSTCSQCFRCAGASCEIVVFVVLK